MTDNAQFPKSSESKRISPEEELTLQEFKLLMCCDRPARLMYLKYRFGLPDQFERYFPIFNPDVGFPPDGTLLADIEFLGKELANLRRSGSKGSKSIFTRDWHKKWEQKAIVPWIAFLKEENRNLVGVGNLKLKPEIDESDFFLTRKNYLEGIHEYSQFNIQELFESNEGRRFVFALNVLCNLFATVSKLKFSCLTEIPLWVFANPLWSFEQLFVQKYVEKKKYHQANFGQYRLKEFFERVEADESFLFEVLSRSSILLHKLCDTLSAAAKSSTAFRDSSEVTNNGLRSYRVYIWPVVQARCSFLNLSYFTLRSWAYFHPFFLPSRLFSGNRILRRELNFWEISGFCSALDITAGKENYEEKRAKVVHELKKVYRKTKIKSLLEKEDASTRILKQSMGQIERGHFSNKWGFEELNVETSDLMQNYRTWLKEKFAPSLLELKPQPSKFTLKTVQEFNQVQKALISSGFVCDDPNRRRAYSAICDRAFALFKDKDAFGEETMLELYEQFCYSQWVLDEEKDEFLQWLTNIRDPAFKPYREGEFLRHTRSGHKSIVTETQKEKIPVRREDVRNILYYFLHTLSWENQLLYLSRFRLKKETPEVDLPGLNGIVTYEPLSAVPSDQEEFTVKRKFKSIAEENFFKVCESFGLDYFQTKKFLKWMRTRDDLRELIKKHIDAISYSTIYDNNTIQVFLAKLDEDEQRMFVLEFGEVEGVL